MPVIRRIVYYVSGHGFGHARRAAEVMRVLLERDPSVHIDVRTGASAWLFEGLGGRVRNHPVEIDPGCVENGLLEIDAEKTGQNLERFMAGMPDRVASEAGFVRGVGASLIVADVPFLAGDVARATGVECIAISNFTWDWIFEELFARTPRHLHWIPRIRESYAAMQTLIRIPWGGVAETFPRVIEAPLIAKTSTRSKESILRAAGIDDADARPRVLIAMRGGISAGALMNAAYGARDCLFLSLGEPDPRWPANVKSVPTGADGLDFSDVLSVSDVVVSKLGYGTVAECIAARKRLLWPRRAGFREDALSEREAARYIPLRELPLDDFTTGHWAPHIHAMLSEKIPDAIARTDGAEVCAEWIVKRLNSPISASAPLPIERP